MISQHKRWCVWNFAGQTREKPINHHLSGGCVSLAAHGAKTDPSSSQLGWGKAPQAAELYLHRADFARHSLSNSCKPVAWKWHELEWHNGTLLLKTGISSQENWLWSCLAHLPPFWTRACSKTTRIKVQKLPLLKHAAGSEHHSRSEFPHLLISAPRAAAPSREPLCTGLGLPGMTSLEVVPDEITHGQMDNTGFSRFLTWTQPLCFLHLWI